MTNGRRLRHAELYDQRIDWLVASLAAIPLVWLFYGFDAAFVSLLLFALIGALKPLIEQLGSRLASGIFAAGLILLLSPLLRFIFYNGYCFEGAWSVAAGINRYASPDLCDGGLFSHFNQDLWVGPLRDLVMPTAGLGMMLVVWKRNQTVETSSLEDFRSEDSAAGSPLQQNVLRFSGLVLALILWLGGYLVNDYAQQVALDAQRKAEVAAIAAEAAAAEKEALREAAEKAAKKVDSNWLLGSWVAIDDLDAEVRRDSRLYCATDSGISFKADGRYSSFDEEGQFRLSDNKIRFSDRMQQAFDEPESASMQLETSTRDVERDGKHLIIAGGKYARC